MAGLEDYTWYPPVNFDLADSPYGPPNKGTLKLITDNLPAGSEIVDIAGGYGRYAEPLAMAGHNITIVDVDQAHLREADNRAAKLPEGSGSISTVEADVIKDDLSGLGEFDSLLCAGFIYLAPRDIVRRVFHSTVPLLKPGGRSVIEFATNRSRTDTSGNSLMGPNEQNYTLRQGKYLLRRMHNETRLAVTGLATIVIDLKEPYKLHTDLIIASGIKAR